LAIVSAAYYNDQIIMSERRDREVGCALALTRFGMTDPDPLPPRISDPSANDVARCND
jgi:hypothetical protein